jgi:predicted methyltransferase
VSDQYVPFWRRFVPEGNWAVHTVPAAWHGSFDLVTSFFALEHVAAPQKFVRAVARLLRPGGVLYGIVPNTYANPADFIVADHVNHFSEPSLRALLGGAGFEVVAVDGLAHSSAWVVVAKRISEVAANGYETETVGALATQAEALANYWSSFGEAVRQFERQQGGLGAAAIYGSGFYGTTIATCLAEFGRVVCFLDQNPHRQKQTLLGIPIRPPEALPPEVRVMYVGLNPAVARSIAGLPAFQGRALAYFVG